MQGARAGWMTIRADANPLPPPVGRGRSRSDRPPLGHRDRPSKRMRDGDGHRRSRRRRARPGPDDARAGTPGGRAARRRGRALGAQRQHGEPDRAGHPPRAAATRSSPRQGAHVLDNELGTAAWLAGGMPRPLPHDAGPGRISPDAVRRAAGRPGPYYALRARLLCLENTHNAAGGTVTAPEEHAALVAAARAAGLRVHLDGARIWHAAVALGVPPAALAVGVDTVSVCLSKGLGAPVGSVVAGSAEFTAEARRLRKMLGGGVRQGGVLAAAGLVALDGIARLAEDHAKASPAGGRAARSRLAGAEPQTNIVLVAGRRPAQRAGPAGAGRGGRDPDGREGPAGDPRRRVRRRHRRRAGADRPDGGLIHFLPGAPGLPGGQPAGEPVQRGVDVGGGAGERDPDEPAAGERCRSRSPARWPPRSPRAAAGRTPCCHR